MGNQSFVGYSPKFYEALQVLAYQEFQYETCDVYPPQHNCHPVDYKLHMDLCVQALRGNHDAVDEILEGYGVGYLEQLFLQIDDVNLTDLLRTGRVSDFVINDAGYYRVTLEDK